MPVNAILHRQLTKLYILISLGRPFSYQKLTSFNELIFFQCSRNNQIKQEMFQIISLTIIYWEYSFTVSNENHDLDLQPLLPNPKPWKLFHHQKTKHVHMPSHLIFHFCHFMIHSYCLKSFDLFEIV